jgi:hypothetical protein
MGIVKKAIKTVSTAIGEILVVGGGLGTMYVLGFLKGSELKEKIGGAVDQVVEAAKTTTTTTTTTEEPATEQEAESTGEDSTPIEVTVNQPED